MDPSVVANVWEGQRTTNRTKRKNDHHAKRLACSLICFLFDSLNVQKLLVSVFTCACPMLLFVRVGGVFAHYFPLFF
jgi:hypothetical protein